MYGKLPERKIWRVLFDIAKVTVCVVLVWLLISGVGGQTSP